MGLNRSSSAYLSKFIAAAAVVLFDAALNYLWDETILQIRKRVMHYDLEYFFDNAVSNSDKRKKLKDEADLVKLDDFELIKGAKEIGLISELGFKHLEYINYMRNWASAAHPNQNELTGLQLVGWLETCVKEVITLPLSNATIKIKWLLGQVKSTEIEDADAEEISVFFDALTQEQINNLASGFFGIYVNDETDTQTRKNIIKLVPLIWDLVDEDVKYSFGIKYANFVANSYQAEKKLAREFLQIVNAESYIPDGLRVVEVESALDSLLAAHNGSNNFYSEPLFARQLKTITGGSDKVPKAINRKYVLTLVKVFITNGHGEAWNAEPSYRELIGQFDNRQAQLAAFSFLQEDVASKLQFDLCSNKFRQLLSIVKGSITSNEVRAFVEEIESTKGRLDNLKKDSNVQRRIRDLRVIIR